MFLAIDDLDQTLAVFVTDGQETVLYHDDLVHLVETNDDVAMRHARDLHAVFVVDDNFVVVSVDGGFLFERSRRLRFLGDRRRRRRRPPRRRTPFLLLLPLGSSPRGRRLGIGGGGKIVVSISDF